MASVRGDRSVYRGDDDETSRRTYTTVKRYQVPEDNARRQFYFDDNEDETKDRKIVVRRTVREDPPPERDNVEYRVRETVRERSPSKNRDEIDIRISERERDGPRRDIPYRVITRDRDSDYSRPRSEFRVVERERSTVRAPSPPREERVQEFRFERDRSWSRSRHSRERDYDVEKYTKSTEYFERAQPQPIIITRDSPPQPQPIIIRETHREPQRIIIREERREPQYEFIERKEVVEETKEETKSLVKVEPEPEPTPVPVPEPVPEKKPEEDYFYERRVIERRRRSDSYDRKTEIRPRDSASQYSSDDSYEYVRREKITEEGGGRDRSPHHRRHLAEGALAGIAAGEIIRHHRKSKGEPAGGRIKSALGGAAVGALGAEGLSRVRSMRSLRDRSRSRSDDRYERRDRRKRRSRSRSRSKSLTRAQTLGGMAAVAALGAVAGYALKNRNKNQETIIVNDRPRRSRSRRRRASVDSYYDDGPMRSESKHRDPEHRNRRIAQAGLASAAAAGIWEKVRSRSRGGKGREKSRIREGVPIAAAGLGGAALAGLYEKNKANKEAKKDAIIQDELNRGRRRRSRSRSRSVPAPYPGDRRQGVDDESLVAYGHEPIHPDGRRGGDYYSDEEPGSYRRPAGSSGSSPDTRLRRSRSRHGHGLAEAGAAAGIAGVAAHELGRRRERSRADRDRRHQDDGRYDRYSEPRYSPPPMSHNGYLPPQQNAGFNQPPQGAYPGSNYFPPPPTGDYAHHEPAYAEPQGAYPAYNPADFAGQPPGQQYQQPYPATRGAYGESEATLGQGYPTDTFAGDTRFGAQQHDPHYNAPPPAGGRNPENVSSPPTMTRSEESPRAEQRSRRHSGSSASADGVEHQHSRRGSAEQPPSQRRPRSTSRVRFDLDSNIAHSPEASRRKDDAKRSGSASSSSDSPDARRRRSRGQRPSSDDEESDGGRDRQSQRRSRRHRDEDGGKERRRSNRSRERDRDRDRENRDPDRDSDGTVDLPDRFDAHGNRKHDPLAEKIQDLLSGKGGAGGIFRSLAEGLAGHHGNEKDDHGDDDGRKRKGRR